MDDHKHETLDNIVVETQSDRLDQIIPDEQRFIIAYNEYGIVAYFVVTDITLCTRCVTHEIHTRYSEVETIASVISQHMRESD